MHIRVMITRDGSSRIESLEMEDYLKGVVPSEIKAESCPAEAMKAQAVAARTYGMRKCSERRGKPYDVDDTAGCQAYGARPRHARSDAAVKATRGQVLTYYGRLVDAVYTDSNGGRCVSALERWGSAVPSGRSLRQERQGARPRRGHEPDRRGGKGEGGDVLCGDPRLLLSRLQGEKAVGGGQSETGGQTVGTFHAPRFL